MSSKSPQRRRWAVRAAVVAAPITAGLLAVALSADGSGSRQAAGLGPEGLPVPAAPPLARAASPGLGQSIDGIACGPSEQLVFHIHARLTVFVAGAPRGIPPGVGIAPPLQIQSTAQGPYASGGGCFSFLHTHAADGLIHIESPVQRTYTLGEFFDVWKQPLGRARVGPATGGVTAFVDGRRHLGDPRAIPLLDRAQIQLDVGHPVVAPELIRLPKGL